MSGQHATNDRSALGWKHILETMHKKLDKRLQINLATTGDEQA